MGGWLPLVNTLSAERWPLLTYTYAAIVIRHVEAVAPEIPVPSYITARHMRFPLSLLFNRSHPEKRRITNQSFNQSHTHTHTQISKSYAFSQAKSKNYIRNLLVQGPRSHWIPRGIVTRNVSSLRQSLMCVCCVFIHTHNETPLVYINTYWNTMRLRWTLFWYMNIGSERDAWIKLPRIRRAKLRIARWLWRKARYFNSQTAAESGV